MTGSGSLNLRMQTALDRLAWGFGDLRRLLVEWGLWPARAIPIVDAGGGGWLQLGARLLSAKVKARRPVGLLVRESQALWGTLQLPDMPRHSLETAVTEAMWRVSPIPPDQIMVAWQVVPGAQQGWSVDWGICKRTQVQEMLTQQGLGPDVPVYLERQGRSVPVRTPGWVAQGRHQRWMDVVGALLVLMLLAALALPSLMPLVLGRQDVVRAVSHVGALEPKAAPLRPQLEELRNKAALVQEIKQGMNNNVPLASVLDGLTEALPDDTWLDRIELNGSEIRIMGLTSNAAELLAKLGRQPLFADVRATTANVRDAVSGKERFAFEMHWRTEGGKP